MDANQPNDLNDLERRLSAWQPAGDQLNAEAMLFAAGRAAGRGGSGRFVWPALACLMTGLSAVLGVWLASERHEKQMLAQRLQERSPASFPASAPAVNAPDEPSMEDQPSPDSYFAAHRALEQGLDAWPPLVIARGDPASTNGRVFTVGSWDALLEQ
jgi:hypothetical protein